MKKLLFFALSVMLAAFASAGKKDEHRFSAAPASSYPAKQTNEGVTIAVASYDTEELAHAAFGKMNPYKYGVLPVLVVVQNDSPETLRLDKMQVAYSTWNGRRIEATPATEVVYAAANPKRPNVNTGGPIPPGIIKHKNPLGGPEIESRAFVARMLPPHEEAHGFFYFQAHHRPGDQVYITGLRQAGTGKDVFYYEIPLN